MGYQNENAAPGATEAARKILYQKRAHLSADSLQAQSARALRPHSKRASMLRVFLELGSRGMNCFEAANHHHDYILRTTVSDYRRNFGIEFDRKYETVPGHNGSKVDCVRYWLSATGAEQARALLGEYEARQQ